MADKKYQWRLAKKLISGPCKLAHTQHTRIPRLFNAYTLSTHILRLRLVFPMSLSSHTSRSSSSTHLSICQSVTLQVLYYVLPTLQREEIAVTVIVSSVMSPDTLR